jgi:hypothetical protein
MASVENYQAPQVEDYDSEQSEVIRSNFPRKSSPSAQANVSTKRSKDLNAEQAPLLEKMPTNIDLRSDSGYSSYTAASKSSADSAPSATSRSPPVMPASTAPAVSQSPAPPKQRRPTQGDSSRQHSNESSPRQKPKAISRTASVSSKQQRPAAGQRRPTVTRDPRDNKDEECSDPNCTTCPPPSKALPVRRRPELLQTASSRNVPGHPSSETMSQRSDPNPYYSPPSPIYHRQPAPYASQGPAVVQTARTRRPSSATRPRPQSFAGDPSGPYWVPGMPAPYPSPPQERGPPPSFSAYQSMQNMPNMQHMQNMQYPQPIPPYMGQQGYYPGHPQQYEGQRPSMSARGSSNYGQSRPAPIITQDDNKYSARYGQPPTPQEPHMRGANVTMPKPKLLQYGNQEEDEESDSDFTDEEYDERESRRQQAQRQLMPPPQLTKREPSQRRPTLTRPNTTQVVDHIVDPRQKRRQSIVVPDPVAPRERERVRERAPRESAAPARRASVSRPPPPHRQTQSEYNTREPARVVVNDSRRDRRKSYQLYEKTYEDFVRNQAAEERYQAERKREKRASRVIVQERQPQRHMPGQYEDDSESEEEEEEEPVRISASRPRRKTESDPRKGKERTVEVKNKRAELSAEEYINATRGSRDPFADQINKSAMKRVSRISQPSDSGSSQSNGSGKASQSNRTTMTSATNNEIRLRVDGTMPLSLQLSGDMEGRTLQLVPAENGMTDLVIGGGNQRSNESVYRSERGSVMVNNSNRRSLIAGQGRRDAEDASERSSRSAHSRRDRESREARDGSGHILRRSRNTTYH